MSREMALLLLVGLVSLSSSLLSNIFSCRIPEKNASKWPSSQVFLFCILLLRLRSSLRPPLFQSMTLCIVATTLKSSVFSPKCVKVNQKSLLLSHCKMRLLWVIFKPMCNSQLIFFLLLYHQISKAVCAVKED